MALPLADHGNLLTALPFVAPAILIVGALLLVTLRDRLRGRRNHGDQER
jgi:hypothetical protein